MKERADGMEKIDFGGVTWHVRASDRDRVLGWLALHLPGVFEKTDELLKNDRGSRVGAAGDIIIKESTARKGRSAPRFGLRRSGSRRAFRIGTELAERGVATPLPLAWATVRRYGLRVRDYLLTERVLSCDSLQNRMEACRDAGDLRKDLMESLGGLLASFHAAGYSNRDMKDSNILVTGTGKGGRLWAVDLDGVRRVPRVGRRRAIRDFWPIVRSLRMHGFGNAADLADLLSGYNVLVPRRLRMEGFPIGY